MKKKIIILALIVALVSAAAGFFLMKKGGGKGPDFPKPVEEYTAGVETVASITASVEEGKDELLLSVSSSEVKEETEDAEADKDADKKEKEEEKEEKEKEAEDEEELDEDEAKERKKEEKRKEKERKKKEKAEKKAQKKREKEEKKRNKEKEDKEEKQEKSNTSAEDTEQTEGAEVPDPWNKYYYQSNGHTVAVLEAYAAYLEEEGFVQVQGKEQQDDMAEESEKKTFHAKYQRKSEEEGYVFSIELEYPLANDPAIQMYAVKATREKAPIDDGTGSQAMTRERALSYLASLDNTSLGLSKPLSEYYVIMDMGRSYVEGKDCYGINVYEKGPQKESYFVQKYYLAIGDQELYSCDVDGVIRRLQPAKGTEHATTTASDATVPTEDAAPATNEPQATGSMSAIFDSENINTNGISHDWNFGPPEEKKEE